jgi:hypothetical protein
MKTNSVKLEAAWRNIPAARLDGEVIRPKSSARGKSLGENSATYNKNL